MIESIMYFGIGFLVAGLLGLLVVPLVHNRAVRLTMRRLDAATPLSMTEIQAEKDQLRAEHAMSTRRLEMSIEQLTARTAGLAGELARKTEAINRLKVELGEKAATIFAIEAREKTLLDRIGTAEQKDRINSRAQQDARNELAEKEAELARLTADLDERTIHADAQRVEIVALQAQSAALKERLNHLERDFKSTEDRLAREGKEAQAVATTLADERGKAENLGERVDQLERQLAARTAEAELLGRRTREQETRLADQERLLTEHQHSLTQARGELENTHASEAHLRAELAATEIRRISAADMLRTETARLETEIDRVRDDRARLQLEIATLRRNIEATSTAENVENALVRERINDIAAEMARLTAALEGPGSAIDAILTGDETPASAEPRVNGPTAGDRPSGDLAERIRALQAKASRAPPTG